MSPYNAISSSDWEVKGSRSLYLILIGDSRPPFPSFSMGLGKLKRKRENKKIVYAPLYSGKRWVLHKTNRYMSTYTKITSQTFFCWIINKEIRLRKASKGNAAGHGSSYFPPRTWPKPNEWACNTRGTVPASYVLPRGCTQSNSVLGLVNKACLWWFSFAAWLLACTSILRTADTN